MMVLKMKQKTRKMIKLNTQIARSNWFAGQQEGGQSKATDN